MESELMKLKSEKALLKKEVLREREEKKQLKEKIVSLESDISKKNQDIETFQLCNMQLFRKCEALQEEQKEKQQGGWGWSLWRTSTSQKQEETESTLSLLKEELDRKIEENESVHVKNYQLKQKYKTKKQEYWECVQSKEQQTRESNSQIDEISMQLATCLLYTSPSPRDS